MASKRPEELVRFGACVVCVASLLAVAAGGCVSKSKARAQARAAYLAGQQEAMVRMQQAQAQGQGPSVTINGEVRNRIVPWTEGLTLAKALVAADYYGAAEPGLIIVVHNGIGRRYDLKQLLNGADLPLEPGDMVQLLSQSTGPKP